MKLFPRVISAVAALSLWLGAVAAETNPEAVSAMLNRIGGSGTSSRFVTVVDETLTTDGKETFVITSAEGKPCIKGSTLSALTTGIGWYLNHHANVNLTWNCPKMDLSGANLPVPAGEERHSSDAAYRYYLNYCTFSYSMSTWTWDRWQEEIDWMALRGINAPLQIIGLEEVWRKFLMEDYGYTQAEVDAYVAGPCFMAWFGMNNLEGWGGPNPEWWYERQAKLGKQIGDRMRSLGIEPVLPGFCQLPSNFGSKTGFRTAATGDWCSFLRPHLADPADSNFDEVAAKFYKRVHEVLGTSKYYSMDPFHEGGGAGSVSSVANVYKKYYEAMDAASPGSQWVIQSWQWSNAQRQSLNNVPVGKLIVLDLFSDGSPNWGSYGNHDVVYSTIFNFGGRTGYFGRAQAVIDGYWDAKTSKSTIKGIGAAPEAIEQTPVVYDLLFELPWYEVKPEAKQWFADYSTRRYGQENEKAAEAWELIRTSALNRQGAGQGPHEALMCARPNLNGNKVSTWGFNELYYDSNDLAKAAYKLIEADLTGENYSFDLADITRQALTDYVRYLIPALRDANNSGNTEQFNKCRDAFLQLILDIDELLNTNSEFMLGHWTQRARDMANEVSGTTSADRDWLELDNARTIITTWGARAQAENGQLRDYSYRQWGGMMKDYYYERWKYWFDHNMSAPSGGWFQWEWDWAHNNPGIYPTEPVGDTREVASRLLSKYLSPFVPQIAGESPYFVQRLLKNDRTGKTFDVCRRDQVYKPNLELNGTEITEIGIDFSKNGSFEESEIIRNATALPIPADAPVGERVCRILLADGTQFLFTVRIIEDITEPRTVRVATSDAEQGSVSIDGTNELSVTNTEVVVLRANPGQKYDFDYWVDENGENIGNDNPMSYYSKESASFTAYFRPNIWGVPEMNYGDKNTIAEYKQYVKTMSVTQGGEKTLLYETDNVPDDQFHYLSQRIKAAPGGEFSFDWTDAGGLRWLFLTAYADLNADGTFEMEAPEFLGKYGQYHVNDNPEVAAGYFNVLLPFDTPQVTTHIRLRFDSSWNDRAWNAQYECFNPNGFTNRLIYEILLEVNEGVEYVTTVTVKSDNTAMGTVRSENSTNVYNPGETVILTAFPKPGYRLIKWVDQHGRELPTEWMTDNMIEFTAYDNAEITAVFEPVPVEIDNWKLELGVDADGRTFVKSAVAEGAPSLDFSADHSEVGSMIDYMLPEAFAGNSALRSVTLPDRQMIHAGDVIYETETVNGASPNKVVTFLKDADGNNLTMDNTFIKYDKPFVMTISGYNNGKSFNQWGSVLFANGDDGLADSFANGWSQFYLRADGTLDVKWSTATATNFPVKIEGYFTIKVDYLGNNQVRVTVTNADGQSDTRTFTSNVQMKSINRFATHMPEGMTVSVKFSEPDVVQVPGELFAGCRNLMDFHVTQACTYAVEKNGVIYAQNGVDCIAYPEGRLLSTPFKLTTAAGASLSAAPVKNGDSLGNLAVSVASQAAHDWNSLWSLNQDYALVHTNSGYGLSSTGTALAATGDSFGYKLTYDAGEPSIAFTNAQGAYLTGNGTSASLFNFDFNPVSVLDAPDGELRTVAFPVNVVVPEGAEVFALERATVDGGFLRHINPGNVIPAGTGVLVQDDADGFVITGEASNVSSDILAGTTVDLILNEPFYLLDGSDFLRHESGTVPANTGYVLGNALDVASFPYQIPGYKPVNIDGWEFDWRYSYDNSAICLTSAVVSGEPSLNLGKLTDTGKTVVDIDPAIFLGNKNLHEVTLPDSQLGRHFYDSSLEGAGEENYTLWLPQSLSGNKAWEMSMELSSDGTGFNQWGSGLFATGTNATAVSYPGGFQLYLQVQSNNGGHIVCKYNGTTEVTFGQVPINSQVITPGVEREIKYFSIDFSYVKGSGDNYTMSIKVSCDGKSQTHNLNFKHSEIKSFCASIPKGVNIEKLHLEGADFLFPYTEGELFAGCSNLNAFHVSDKCDYAVEREGVLYSKAAPEKCIAYPEARLFTCPFVLTAADGVHVAAAPVLMNGELTETEVSVAEAANPMNALWMLGEQKLTHLNSGIHLNYNGGALSDVYGEYAYHIVYGNGEPSITFSLAEDRHLNHSEGSLSINAEPHAFSFLHQTVFSLPESDGPSVASFPVDVVVPEGSIVKGVSSISESGAVLFDIPEGSVIPAGHAVMTIDGDCYFPAASAYGAMTYADIKDNLLRGTNVAIRSSEPYYQLEGDNFVRHENGLIPANSAYISAENLEVESFPYDASTTGVIEVGTDCPDEMYDLMGRRVSSAARHGFYILNGKVVRR